MFFNYQFIPHYILKSFYFKHKINIMIKLSCFEYDFSLHFFIENFCDNKKLGNLSLISIVKENILSHFFSLDFNLFKKKIIKKNNQFFLIKNEFLVKLGDKISYLVGLFNFKKFNSKFMIKFNLDLSILIMAQRNLPFDLKIFLTVCKKNIKQKSKEENATNNDLLINQISVTLFILKKFKNSANCFVNCYNSEYNKKQHVLFNLKLFLEWLKHIKNSNIWNKIESLNLKFKWDVAKNNSDEFNLSKRRYKYKFNKILKIFQMDTIFVIHRYKLFKIYRKVLIFQFYCYFEIILITSICRNFKFSGLICKELQNIYSDIINDKLNNFILFQSKSQNLKAIKLISQNINQNLVRFKLIF